MAFVPRVPDTPYEFASFAHTALVDGSGRGYGPTPATALLQLWRLRRGLVDAIDCYGCGDGGGGVVAHGDYAGADEDADARLPVVFEGEGKAGSAQQSANCLTEEKRASQPSRLAQMSLTFRSIVLITSSICPFSTCFARLRV